MPLYSFFLCTVRLRNSLPLSLELIDPFYFRFITKQLFKCFASFCLLFLLTSCVIVAVHRCINADLKKLCVCSIIVIIVMWLINYFLIIVLSY